MIMTPKKESVEPKQALTLNLDCLIPKIDNLIDEFKTINILLRIMVVAMFLLVLSQCVRIE